MDSSSIHHRLKHSQPAISLVGYPRFTTANLLQLEWNTCYHWTSWMIEGSRRSTFGHSVGRKSPYMGLVDHIEAMFYRARGAVVSAGDS